MTNPVAEVINTLYQHVQGMHISLSERERLKIEDPAFTYGEILPETFQQVLMLAAPQAGEVFYDLGAGAGKAVFTAALVQDWKKCCGIELLPGLVQQSRDLLEPFQQSVKRQQYFPARHVPIEFHEGNFLTTDFSDADVVYLHATTFGPEVWESLAEKLRHLKPGARILINTKRLPDPGFQLLAEEPCVMSWGQSTIFIYRVVK